MPRPSKLNFAPVEFDRDRDYELIARWWLDSGVEPLPQSAMPSMGAWAVAEGVKLAAAFVYATDSDVFIMAFPIACPDLDWRNKAEAISFAIEAMAKAIREHWPNAIIVSLSHDPSVHQTYVKRAGFHDTGSVRLGVSAPSGFDLDIFTE